MYSETMVEIEISECKSGFVCYYLGEFILLIFNNFMFFLRPPMGNGLQFMTINFQSWQGPLTFHIFRDLPEKVCNVSKASLVQM